MVTIPSIDFRLLLSVPMLHAIIDRTLYNKSPESLCFEHACPSGGGL
jgi:hypothetical protein